MRVGWRDVGRHLRQRPHLGAAVLSVVVAVEVLALVGFWWGAFEDHTSPRTMVLTTDGFEPRRITIEQGETVTFRTETEGAFWPASDVHPYHDINPAFDPGRPIPATSTWSHTFVKPGSWGLHDHLRPQHTGTIEVERADGTTVREPCADADATDTEFDAQCWRERIITTVEEEGIVPAFELLSRLYDNEPQFAGACHGFTHFIGYEAYERFVSDEPFDLTPKVSYCGYGFFHGFMEQLMFTSRDFREAREFCDVVNRKLDSASNAACFHGIGHGAVDGSNPEAYGDAAAMIAPGMELCRQATETRHQLYLCKTGVYNSIEILARNETYDVREQVRGNPFAFCRQQEAAGMMREACYTNMLPVLVSRFDRDLSAVARYAQNHMKQPNLQTVNGNTVLEQVMIGLGMGFVQFHLNNADFHAHAAAFCQGRAEATTTNACVRGLALGVLKHGSPESAYRQVGTLCDADVLTSSQQRTCYRQVASHITTEQCSVLPEQYQDRCITQ